MGVGGQDTRGLILILIEVLILPTIKKKHFSFEENARQG